MQTRKTDNEILEEISAVFDGEGLPEGKLPKFGQEASRHLQNWSVIGSALRHELPPKVDLSFADKVMAQVEQTKIDLVEQPAELKLPATRKFSLLKRCGLIASQLAVAASVAAVTVIGWQTYSAGSVPALDEPAANAVMGSAGGLSLASYQNDNRELKLNVSNIASKDVMPGNTKPDAETLRQMQQKEMERINHYVRGYILHSAAE